MFRLLPSLLFLWLSSAASHAHAASPVSNVGTARVDVGKRAIEARTGYTEDDRSTANDNRLQLREHIDMHFTNWYGIRLVTSQDKRDGDNVEHNRVTFENWFQLIEERDYGWDGGFRVIYGHSDGDKTPHKLDVRLMAQGPVWQDWQWRHNSIFTHEIGENSKSGVSFEWRHQLTKKIIFMPDIFASFRLGAELFNDFSKLNQLSGYANQDHQFGPVIKASFHNGLYLQTGYRTGISRQAADHSIKLFIGTSF